MLYKTYAIKPTRGINRVVYSFYLNAEAVFDHIINQIVSSLFRKQLKIESLAGALKSYP
jgi:DNA-binding MltR family transcriptional regulator